jgi:hypothetical protein
MYLRMRPTASVKQGFAMAEVLVMLYEAPRLIIKQPRTGERSNLEVILRQLSI